MHTRVWSRVVPCTRTTQRDGRRPADISRQQSDGERLDARSGGGVTDNITGYNNRITEENSTIGTKKTKKAKGRKYIKRRDTNAKLGTRHKHD